MRQEKLNQLRTWLMENMPQTPIEQRSINFIPKKERAKILKQKTNQYKEKTVDAINWRQKLADRLSINYNDVTLATNTIIVLIEQTLAKGENVRLKNFGDFIICYYENIIRTRFKADEQWLRAINGPLFKDEIGLIKTLKNKRLQKRAI
jgi:hypothetical protein